MRTREEIIEALCRCRRIVTQMGQRGHAKCWMYTSGITCNPHDCSTRETLRWVLGTKTGGVYDELPEEAR